MDRKLSRRRTLALRRSTLRVLTADAITPVFGAGKQTTDSKWADSCLKCGATGACPIDSGDCGGGGGTLTGHCDTKWNASCLKC